MTSQLVIFRAFLFIFFRPPDPRSEKKIPVNQLIKKIWPNSLADFSSDKQLIRQDVQVFHRSLVVRIKWSKTNQFGSRLLKKTINSDTRLGALSHVSIHPHDQPVPSKRHRSCLLH